MNLLKLCQEFDKLTNTFVVVLDTGMFYRGRSRGGIIIHTKNIDEAKTFSSRESALTTAEHLWNWMLDFTPDAKRRHPVAMPLNEAKKIISMFPHRK
jgi:hypothetical protein